MGRFDGHDPARGTDTAGTPWAGRDLTGTGFDDDRGQADPALLAAVSTQQDERVMAAVQRARLLVPVVAVSGEGTTSRDQQSAPTDAGSDMAAVTLVAPDGRRALPVFSSLAALTDWDASARPVPVTAARAAQAAVQERCDQLLLDLPPTPGPPAYTLRPSMVWALATGRDWVPSHRDEHVARAVARAVRAEEAVGGHELAAAPDGALALVLTLRPGLGEPEVAELVQRIGEQVATDGEARARVDALSVRIRPA